MRFIHYLTPNSNSGSSGGRTLILALLTFLFLNGMITDSPAKEKIDFKPLFPVQIDHKFIKPHETFEEVKDLILKHYYSAEITEEALYWAAIQGMLRQISPPENPDLAKIWMPEEYDKVHDSLKGVQVSIGIKSSFNPADGSLTVTEVLPGSPADAFLKPQDRILRIDSQSLKGKSLKEVKAFLEGKVGASITFTVNRDIKIFEVNLKFKELKTQNLIVTRLSETIALIEIKYFTANISKSLKEELEELAKEGFKGLIIDLRNNSGGVFIESLQIVELFLPKNRILLRTLQRETQLQSYASANRKPFKFEISILVNHKTASSAEILTSSLQDHQQALIVGTRTFGKAVFEKTYTLENQYRLKFITGAMYSPRGRSWQSIGVTPDFLVEQDDNTLDILLKMEPKERLRKDVAMITAYKLLVR